MPGIFELTLYLMLSFGIGTFLGHKSAEQDLKDKTLPVERSGPDKFTQSEMKDMIRECRIACGKNRFKQYNSLDGDCECVDSK